MSDQADTQSKIEQTLKMTRKTLAEEFRRFLENFAYLTLAFSVLETYRSLVLLQFGVNSFVHNYCVAVTGAFIMGKLVTFSQRIKFFEIFDEKPLIWSVVYRTALMTVFVAIFKYLEELIFNSSHKMPGFHTYVLTITHYLGIMFVFFVLFTVRGLDRKLGSGTLSSVFFGIEQKRKDAS